MLGEIFSFGGCPIGFAFFFKISTPCVAADFWGTRTERKDAKNGPK
jgi:hypothetical protein